MRATVVRAVPDGASALLSWCSSMTSAVSKNGAAISAKRIISTAEIEKLAATTQFGSARELVAELRQVVVGEAGRADDGVDAVHRQPRHGASGPPRQR